MWPRLLSALSQGIHTVVITTSRNCPREAAEGGATIPIPAEVTHPGGGNAVHEGGRAKGKRTWEGLLLRVETGGARRVQQDGNKEGARRTKPVRELPSASATRERAKGNRRRKACDDAKTIKGASAPLRGT